VAKFKERQWVDDIVLGAVTGMLGGAISSMSIYGPPAGDAVTFGGLIGLVTGVMYQPIKYGLDRLRGPGSTEENHDQ